MFDATSRKGWTRVAFGDVVRLSRERSNNPEGDRLERYVGLEHLDPGDLKVRRWGSVLEGTTFTNVFRAGQVLFGKRRAYQRKVAVAPFDGVCSGDIYVMEPKDARLLPALLPFICQTDRFFEYAVGTSAGSLSPRTNWRSLANFEFGLPPLEQQLRISSLMGAVDGVIEGLANCLASCERMVASLRSERFDPGTFESVPLATLCHDGEGIQIGPFGAQLHQSDYEPEGIPVVMPVNMGDDRIITDGIARIPEAKARALANHRIEAGDILLPRRGELDRRAFTTRDNAGWICGTGSVRVRVDRHVPAVAVFHALASQHSVRWLASNAVGTTMPNVNS